MIIGPLTTPILRHFNIEGDQFKVYWHLTRIHLSKFYHWTGSELLKCKTFQQSRRRVLAKEKWRSRQKVEGIQIGWTPLRRSTHNMSTDRKHGNRWSVQCMSTWNWLNCDYFIVDEFVHWNSLFYISLVDNWTVNYLLENMKWWVSDLELARVETIHGCVNLRWILVKVGFRPKLFYFLRTYESLRQFEYRMKQDLLPLPIPMMLCPRSRFRA